MERAKCLSDNYDNFKIPGTNATGKGSRVLGEVIADNGGSAESYIAYSKTHEAFVCSSR